MRLPWVAIVGALLAAVLPVLASTTRGSLAALATPPAVPLTYWHNWSSLNGPTRFTECALTNFTLSDYLPGTPSLYTDSVGTSPKMTFVQLPPGWEGSWHKDPAVQLVVILSGQAWWRMESNQTRQFSPGDVYLGNDQLSHKGHMSGAVTGSGTVNMMLLELDVDPRDHVGVPCWLK